MSCSDLPDWYLQRRIAVVDLRSAAWRRARAEVVPPGYAPDECLRRLAKARRVRRIGRGLFVVADPVRETAAIAIASALFADEPHYVTTDAALAFHGAIDQPVRQITVVLAHRRRPLDIGPSVVRPVMVRADRLATADAFDTSTDGFKVRVATREQAVVDALVEPGWIVYGDLLPEVDLYRNRDRTHCRGGIGAVHSCGPAPRLLTRGRRPPCASLTCRPAAAAGRPTASQAQDERAVLHSMAGLWLICATSSGSQPTIGEPATSATQMVCAAYRTRTAATSTKGARK